MEEDEGSNFWMEDGYGSKVAGRMVKGARLDMEDGEGSKVGYGGW